MTTESPGSNQPAPGARAPSTKVWLRGGLLLAGGLTVCAVTYNELNKADTQELENEADSNALAMENKIRIKKLQKQRASLPVAAIAWLTDYAKAMEQAKTGNRLLLLDFTGSDWCPMCMNIKRTLLDTNEFSDYAGKNLVLLEVDFPGPMIRQTPELKKQNKDLDAKYKVDGSLPTLVILNSDGKELGRLGGEKGAEYLGQIADKGPSALIAELEKLKAKS